MKISDIIAALLIFAPNELQEDYDNCGLITGDSDASCTGVLCTLDVTVEVIEEAKLKGYNLIISHHPIVFRGVRKLSGPGFVEQTLVHAIKHDMALFALHTSLDNVIMGVNGKIASLLHLKHTMVLEPKPGMLRRLITFGPVDKAEIIRKALFAAGAGKIGQYGECSFNSEGTGTFLAEEGAHPFVGAIGKRHEEKETKIEVVFPFYMEKRIVESLIAHHPYEEVAYDIIKLENVHNGIGSGIMGELHEPCSEADFLKKLNAVFRCPAIRHSPFTNKIIKRVAVCGGSGSFLIATACREGVDAFVTADITYHRYFEALNRLLLVDIGHYESEQFTTDLIYDLIVQNFPTFAVAKSGVITNPVHYFIGN